MKLVQGSASTAAEIRSPASFERSLRSAIGPGLGTRACSVPTPSRPAPSSDGCRRSACFRLASTDKFRAIEKRLGTKRALLCEVEAPDGPIVIVVVHLDPFAPPIHRARQLRTILAAVERMGVPRVLVGGDFNTNTYHLGSKIGLGVDIAHKLARFGFAGTIEQYMTPDRVFERGVFRVLAGAGYVTEGFTDPGAGTIHYDLRDPEVREKSLHYLPGFAFRWMENKLRRWDGCVPMRVDHFAGRGLRPVRALTLPRDMPGGRVSDHAPIVLEFVGA